MDSNTASKLIELNQLFYQTFAVQFSQTRQRLQPGVRRIMEGLPPSASILDLGCGTGELARQLLRRGYRGVYVGLDFSTGLLEKARERISSQGLAAGLLKQSPEGQAIFLQADLSAPGWEESLPRRSFDYILAFAVLHHLPGDELRSGVLRASRGLLQAQGRFIHSEWQFLNSPRLAARVLLWETLGLSAGQVDPGDYLLDWRQGGYGRRYVHHFTPEELDSLASRSGFHIVDTFSSDGESQNLSLYQIWE